MARALERRVGCDWRAPGKPPRAYGMDGLSAGRARDSGGPDPAKHYQLALGADPGNVYAHAMWGFELLRKRRSSEALAKAQQHFAAALETAQERDYLRNVEVSALLQT